MLFPQGGAIAYEHAESKALYKKTHGNFDPGEQKQRDYKWKFDPNENVFGRFKRNRTKL